MRRRSSSRKVPYTRCDAERLQLPSRDPLSPSLSPSSPVQRGSRPLTLAICFTARALPSPPPSVAAAGPCVVNALSIHSQLNLPYLPSHSHYRDPHPQSLACLLRPLLFLVVEAFNFAQDDEGMFHSPASKTHPLVTHSPDCPSIGIDRPSPGLPGHQKAIHRRHRLGRSALH